MFDPSSRYFANADALHIASDGSQTLYKRRRMLPQPGQTQPGTATPGSGTPVQEVVVGPADRLDLIAARALGDPLQFWRIADANAAMDPFALVTPGDVLIVTPLRPGPGGSR